MASRMEKYYHEDEKLGLRSKKNADLYKEISNSEIDKFEISNNATVLSNVNNNIDVEKIKKILDTKYNRARWRSVYVAGRATRRNKAWRNSARASATHRLLLREQADPNRRS